MAKIKCTLVKAGTMKAAGSPAKMKVGDAPPVEIQLYVDSGPLGGLTVFGTTQGGGQAALDGVATVTAESSDPSILQVGDILGAHVAYTGLKVGTADLTLVVTANDGSFGPFTLTIHATMAKDPANTITGIGVTLDANVVVS